jgi:Protein of unknown function (DUF3313)
MNRKKLFVLLIAALAGTALAASIGAAPQATSDGLIAVQSRSLDELYVRPNVDLSSYHKVIVDPAEAALKKNWLKDTNAQRNVQRWLVPEDAERITREAASSLRTVVAETFKARGYEIAIAPAEDVLRLSPSVTDLYVNAPDVPAPGIQRSFVRDAGEATLHLDVRDAVTGTLLARVVDRDTAREIQRNNNSATNASNLFWFDALFRQWATNCAKAFETTGTRDTAQARP